MRARTRPGGWRERVLSGRVLSARASSGQTTPFAQASAPSSAIAAVNWVLSDRAARSHTAMITKRQPAR